ncbi:ABC transporter substrate-binding protein [Microbacterium sp. NFH-22A-Y]|uniref:ABC transporter substrate-binding protein n=1 Tax=Microbacterium sp. NFH-22A-Y TaxID=2744448 RepID=UPI001F1A7B84|nr:ABC transporter substrate-binding protein [Microbacterium sp. NFH-22A-Y]
MKKTLLTGLALALTAATAIGLAGCSAPNGSGEGGGSGETLTVGRILPLTGPLAGLGTRVAAGSEIARQIINEEGGINGVSIEFKDQDAPDEEAARRAAERLLNEDVDIVLGSYGSAIALAAIPVITGEGGLYWETGASAVAITDGTYDNVYRYASTAQQLGADAVNFSADVIAEKLGKAPGDLKIAWAGVNNTYGSDVLTGMKAVADADGMEFVLEEAYPVDSSDLTSVALKIRDSAPDVLVLTSYDADAAALGRALRAADVTPPAIIGTGGGHVNEAWMEAMGDSGNGFFNVGFTPAVNSEGLTPEAKSTYEKFVEKFKATNNGEAPGTFDMNGFAGAMALFEAMKQAEDLTPDGIAAAADALDLPERSMPDGLGVKFDANGQNERSFFFVGQWQDGEMVPVYPLDLGLGEPRSIPLPGWNEAR